MKALLIGLAAVALATPCEAKKWRTYENCTLIPNEANDGDSFHVKCKRRHYLFRLYYVDAPETDDSVPERVTEQAAYFGISERDTIRLGKEAAKFTEEFLAKGFTAYSKLSDAMGRSDMDRDYAMVQVGKEYLCEALVANGLARIHGNVIDLPDGTSSRLYYWRLKKAERSAKDRKLGGWSQQLSRIEQMAQRSTTAPAQAPAAARPAAREEPEQVEPARPAGPVLPQIEEQTITLTRGITVYSLKEQGKAVGILQAGAEVRVLGAESPSMVRIRFKASSGVVYEAQCWKVELGL